VFCIYAIQVLFRAFISKYFFLQKLVAKLDMRIFQV